MNLYGRRRHYHRRSDPAKFEKAYEMRHNPTPAEQRMWTILWQQVIPNSPEHIFRRQWVAFGYILDFYCPTLRLGIEVDGSVHDERESYDSHRDSVLARHNIDVYRFNNDDVFNNPQSVASDLRKIVQNKTGSRFIQPQSAELQHARTNQQKCFIATAAYETPMAQEINTLRRFRDLRMEPNLIARYLIVLYYYASPPFARVISRSENMKAFVRLNLKPIIRFLESNKFERMRKSEGASGPGTNPKGVSG